MATTYWVGADGDNQAAGTSYETRFADWYVGVRSLTSQGDVLNVVGEIGWPDTSVTTPPATGSADYEVDPNFIIQGTDSAGIPAMATVKATATQFVDVCLPFDDGGAGEGRGIIRGITFDATLGAGSLPVLRMDDAVHRVLFESCAFLGSTDGEDPGGGTWIFKGATRPATGYAEVRYCYLQGCEHFMRMDSGEPYIVDFHHNVCYWKNPGSTYDIRLFWGPTLNAGTASFFFYNNTVILDTDAGGTAYNNAIVGSATAVVSQNPGDINHYDNLFWYGLPTGANAGHSIFSGNSGTKADAAPTVSVHRGNNYFASNETEVRLKAAFRSIYRQPWDEDNDTATLDIYVSDTVDAETTLAATFNAPTTAWSWPSKNYLIPMLGDFRPKVGATDGKDSGQVGALAVAGIGAGDAAGETTSGTDSTPATLMGEASTGTTILDGVDASATNTVAVASGFTDGASPAISVAAETLASSGGTLKVYAYADADRQFYSLLRLQRQSIPRTAAVTGITLQSGSRGPTYWTVVQPPALVAPHGLRVEWTPGDNTTGTITVSMAHVKERSGR